MRFFIIISLFIFLLFTGCIKGNVKTENNESANLTLSEIDNNATITYNNTNNKNQTGKEEEKHGFFPWNNKFKDLDSFHLKAYYIKSTYIDDVIRNSSFEIAGNPDAGILEIWFSKNDRKLRIDRYDNNYLGKDFCDKAPKEFIEYNSTRYALTAREIYSKNTINKWQYAIITRAIVNGGKQVWACQMNFFSDTIPKSIGKSADAIDIAYALYSTQYAKPHIYYNDKNYDDEIKDAKARYSQYYESDGARYIKETNALRQNGSILDRAATKFYIKKDFGVYGYELMDSELGIGMAYYIEKIQGSDKEINLLNPFLLYAILEFNQTIDKTVFET